MSFLQKSALHKHLSTSRHMPTLKDANTTEGTRVILRDGNLITVPVTAQDEAPTTQASIKLS